MPAWPKLLLGLVTFEYIGVGVGYYVISRNWQQTLIYFGYALANVGLLCIR